MAVYLAHSTIDTQGVIPMAVYIAHSTTESASET